MFITMFLQGKRLNFSFSSENGATCFILPRRAHATFTFGSLLRPYPLLLLLFLLARFLLFRAFLALFQSLLLEVFGVKIGFLLAKVVLFLLLFEDGKGFVLGQTRGRIQQTFVGLRRCCSITSAKLRLLAIGLRLVIVFGYVHDPWRIVRRAVTVVFLRFCLFEGAMSSNSLGRSPLVRASSPSSLARLGLSTSARRLDQILLNLLGLQLGRPHLLLQLLIFEELFRIRFIQLVYGLFCLRKTQIFQFHALGRVPYLILKVFLLTLQLVYQLSLFVQLVGDPLQMLLLSCGGVCVLRSHSRNLLLRLVYLLFEAVDGDLLATIIFERICRQLPYYELAIAQFANGTPLDVPFVIFLKITRLFEAVLAVGETAEVTV